MSILSDITGVIGSVAPTIAKALGGPLAGTAINTIAKALGLDDETPDAVAQVIARATPEQLIAIKQADADFAVKMRQLDIDFARVNADDRNSARQREIAIKDRTPAILALVLTVGFFGLLGWMMQAAPPDGSRDLLNIMLGALGAGFSMMLAYYYGSSAGTVLAANEKK
ncbi:MAG: hypothetical protein HGB02_03645 [Chlorobiaceae bacterium]|nr:hypothetical protein [Chlorobiaceae bacterium]